MTLGHAQFEALFAGLDWRRIHAVVREHECFAGRVTETTSEILASEGLPSSFPCERISWGSQSVDG